MCAIHAVHALSSSVTNLTNKTLIFHDFQGLTIKFRGFPGLENEILKFHDFPGFPWPVQTLSETECSLLAEASFPWYLAGGRKRDHLPGGGTLMLGNSGGDLHSRGVKAHSQRGKIPSQNCKIKTIYIGLRRIPLNCIHLWRLYFYKIWVCPKNNSKKMGLALKNFMTMWFLVHPWRFWYKLIFIPEEFHPRQKFSIFITYPWRIPLVLYIAISHLVHLLNLLANIEVNIKLKSARE